MVISSHFRTFLKDNLVVIRRQGFKCILEILRTVIAKCAFEESQSPADLLEQTNITLSFLGHRGSPLRHLLAATRPVASLLAVTRPGAGAQKTKQFGALISVWRTCKVLAATWAGIDSRQAEWQSPSKMTPSEAPPPSRWPRLPRPSIPGKPNPCTKEGRDSVMKGAPISCKLLVQNVGHSSDFVNFHERSRLPKGVMEKNERFALSTRLNFPCSISEIARRTEDVLDSISERGAHAPFYPKHCERAERVFTYDLRNSSGPLPPRTPRRQIATFWGAKGDRKWPF